MSVHERNSAAGERDPFARVFGQGRGVGDVEEPARRWRGCKLLCVETSAGPVCYVGPNNLSEIVQNGSRDIRSLTQLDRAIRRRFGGEAVVEPYGIRPPGAFPDVPNSRYVGHRTAMTRKRGRRGS